MPSKNYDDFNTVGKVLRALDEGKVSIDHIAKKVLGYKDASSLRGQLRKYNVVGIPGTGYTGQYAKVEKENPSVLEEVIRANTKSAADEVAATSEPVKTKQQVSHIKGVPKKLSTHEQNIIKEITNAERLPLFIRAHYLEKPESTSKTNVNLATELMEWLKDTAAKEKISQGELLTMALLDFKDKYFPGE